MAKLLAGVLLCVPFAAGAENLFLEYEGTVSSIEGAVGCDCPSLYAAGATVKGTLIIDTERAPPDRDLGDPQRGSYFTSTNGPDFISGRSHASIGSSGDSVVVFDDWDPPVTNGAKEDILSVSEGRYQPGEGPNAPRLGEDFLSINVRRISTFGQLFPNDGLVQAFDVTPEEGTTMWGYLERGVGELRQVFNFALTRVSLTPGSCRA